MEPKVGDHIERDGKTWEVTSVVARLTPYRKANQFTTVEGYTLGLREIKDVCPTCKQPLI